MAPWFPLMEMNRIVPVDQNHSEHAPPSNPSLVESNQTNLPHPVQDHNQSIPPSDTNGLVPVEINHRTR